MDWLFNIDKMVRPEDIFYFTLVFLWASYLWEEYLARRQVKIYRSTVSIPAELIGVIDQTTFTKARLYNLDKAVFGFWRGLWGQVFTTSVLWYGGIPFMWSFSEALLRRTGLGPEFQIPHTAIFTFVALLLGTIVDLPWSLYSTFRVEQKHGFNKQSLGFYLKDKLKKFWVCQFIVIPVISCIIYIVQVGGDYFFIYLWAFCVLVTLVLMTVYPDYIAPLFDKFVPLPEGELRSQIEKLASSISFPLTKIYVVEGSKRSAHSNAYFYGFFNNKHIVLFDTLLEDYNPLNVDGKETSNDVSKGEENETETKKSGCNMDEVLAILGHELGHWKLNHVLKNLVIAQVNLFLCFAIFAVLYKQPVLYKAFGFYDTQPVFIGLVVILQYIFSPYNELLNFFITMLSRRFEFQADAFAKSLSRATDLRSALIKLNMDNLGFPVYDKLYSAWHHSHPPLLERIRALGKFD